MGSKAITDQDTWSLVSSFFSFGIKYMLKPLKADLRVSIPRVGAHILPSRGREHGPVALIGTRWPDNHRVQIPTITTNIFDYSHGCMLDSHTSIISYIMYTHKNLDRAWYGKHHSSLVYVIDILG